MCLVSFCWSYPRFFSQGFWHRGRRCWDSVKLTHILFHSVDRTVRQNRKVLFSFIENISNIKYSEIDVCPATPCINFTLSQYLRFLSETVAGKPRITSSVYLVLCTNLNIRHFNIKFFIETAYWSENTWKYWTSLAFKPL